MARFAQHLNGNQLCVVDTETTGLIAGYHDLIQVCVMPLDSFFKPLVDEKILPFILKIKPRRPENVDLKAMSINKMELCDIMKNGIDPDQAADYFERWFENLNLPKTEYKNKKLAPLAQNWIFDRGFLIDWLGPLGFDHCFHYEARDTMTAALYINDRASYKAEPIPLPKVNLSYLASQLKVQNERAHDAVSDSVTCAEIYRRMLMMPVAL